MEEDQAAWAPVTFHVLKVVVRSGNPYEDLDYDSRQRCGSAV
jgi:hypothetical protein